MFGRFRTASIYHRDLSLLARFASTGCKPSANSVDGHDPLITLYSMLILLKRVSVPED